MQISFMSEHFANIRVVLFEKDRLFLVQTHVLTRVSVVWHIYVFFWEDVCISSIKLLLYKNDTNHNWCHIGTCTIAHCYFSKYSIHMNVTFELSLDLQSIWIFFFLSFKGENYILKWPQPNKNPKSHLWFVHKYSCEW